MDKKFFGTVVAFFLGIFAIYYLQTLQHANIQTKVVHRENILRFLPQKSHYDQVEEHSQQKSDYVVYNRVAKCGSGGMAYVLRLLSKKNGFKNLFHYNKTDKHQLTKDMISTLMVELQDHQSRKTGLNNTVFFKEFFGTEFPRIILNQIRHVPFIYTRHFFHHPFPRNMNITYINLIRDPLARFVSKFYYDQIGFAHHLKPNVTHVESVNNCIGNGNRYCVKGLLNRFFL